MSNVTLMTVSEAAAEFGVAVKTVHRWIAAGKLPVARRLPGRTGAVLLDAHEVRTYAALRSTRAAS